MNAIATRTRITIITADMMIALINLIVAGVTVTEDETNGGWFTLVKGEDDARLSLRHDGAFGYAYPGVGSMGGAVWHSMDQVTAHFA